MSFPRTCLLFFFFHFLRSIDLHHVAAFLNLFAIKVLIKCVIDIITNHDLARKACGAEVINHLNYENN